MVFDFNFHCVTVKTLYRSIPFSSGYRKDQPQIRSYLNNLCRSISLKVLLMFCSVDVIIFWCSFVLFFRCIKNCLAKVSPVRPLTLRVVCSNRPCITIATFSWTMHIPTINGQGKSTWSELKNTTGLITTSVSTTQFHLPRLDDLTNIKEGQKFQVQVTATDHNGILQEQAFYTFNVNSPPKLVNQATGCQVNPTEGSAIITDFRISCLGWYDSDIPLRYAFKYKFSFSTIIIQDGKVGEVTTKLPLGNPDEDYNRNLTLQIIDAYGEFSMVNVPTTVRCLITDKQNLAISVKWY